MNSKKYTLGLVSISFRQHSPKEIIKAVKNAGLACIEWGSDVHAPCKDLERLNEIAALQKEYGISCSSYGTYFRLGDTPIEELTDYINAAKILGTKIIRLWCGTKSGDEMTDAEKSELYDMICVAFDYLLTLHDGETGEFIHGNKNPDSLGKYASKGCMRMDNEVIQYLAPQMKRGDIVIIKK